MSARINYKIGDIIGTCTYLEERESIVFGKSIKRKALFKCPNCNKEFEALLLGVKSGNTKSCGCLRDSNIQQQGFKNKIHGHRKHPIYLMWQGMLSRCYNSNHIGYSNYGARGVIVCERWKDINNFIQDMFPTYVKGLDLDRLDNSGNYEPSNCRWITRKKNMNNMRRNRIIEYKGVKKTISEWSDHLNIPYKRLIARLNNWDVSKAFTYQISYK
jgi:hypothetical protein